MVIAAILEIQNSKVKSTLAKQHLFKISINLKHLEVFRIFAVSLVTAAIFEMLLQFVLTIIIYHQLT